MAQAGLTLRKALGRDQGTDLVYLSALWEIEELPGLRMRQIWDRDKASRKVWIIKTRLYLKERGMLSEQVLHIERELHMQRFPTRQAALQAIEMAAGTYEAA